VLTRRSHSLSLAEARRIILTAQGFARPRLEEEASKGELRSLLRRLGAVQIDSVNVLARAHMLPAYSRLGRYRPEDLHALCYGGRRRALFEYWGHEASLLPVGLQPLLRWRMQRAARGEGIYRELAHFGRERRALIDEICREIADRGPLAARELSHQHKGEGGWWGWSEGKRALEWLFWTGRVTTATRRGAFERVYDLSERVLPATVMQQATPDPADAQRELLRIAARALGLATRRCLRDYFRLDAAEAAPRIDELVEGGELIPVTVEGWGEVAYLCRGVRSARRIEARALLAPFDPLIWQRQRTEAVFGVRIRLEIYTPRHKRAYGYYVLPLLLGEQIVARVDLKADRGSSALRVEAAYAEAGLRPAPIVEPLVAELRLLAAWLALQKVEVGARGDLCRLLFAALSRG
jgi:uncharacterized protein YcaQ